MKYFCLTLLLITPWGHAAETSAGITLEKPWQSTIYQFARQQLQHSAWGLEHYQRNYLLTQQIAKLENIPFDSEVVFAAAFLHDLGVFEPYLVKGAEHSQTAVANIDDILASAGFPMSKVKAVKVLILAHMFYADAGENKLAQAFHDADTLDFLGAIGITRILSVTSRHRWARDLTGALGTIEKFHAELPAKLYLASSKKIAQQKVKAAQSFMQSLQAEAGNGAAL